jgi:hypothetical protein
MNILSPKLSTEDVQSATEKKFTSAPVEAGEYDMVIKTAPKVLTSKAGNSYLQLMLTHTGEQAKGTTAVYPNFNANAVGSSQFAQLLLSLGFSPEQVADQATGWGAISDEADDKGRRQGGIMVAGDQIDLEGRPVRVYLKKAENEYNGKTIKNEVAPLHYRITDNAISASAFGRTKISPGGCARRN